MSVRLEINSLGYVAGKKQYRDQLVDYLADYQKDLDVDSQRCLNSEPLRILDSKTLEHKTS